MCLGNEAAAPVDTRGTPLDMSMARNPAKMMMPNPFGMGPDYDASPVMDPTGQPTMGNFPPRFDSNGFDAMPRPTRTESPIAMMLRKMGGF